MARDQIYIAIPTIDGKLHSECLFGVLETWTHFPCRLSIERGSFLPRLRDKMTAHFLADTECSHMLCVDSDIQWTMRDFAKLLEIDVPFASGVYQQKFPGGALCISGEGKPAPEIDPNVLTHARVGAGFLLLRRDAVQLLWDVYSATDSYFDRGEHLVGLWQTEGRILHTGLFPPVVVAEGEDFAFCRRWTAIDGKIYVHYEVQLGHVGPHIWRPGT